MTTLIDEFKDSIVNLNIDADTSICRKLIKSSKVPADEIFSSIGKALDVVGQRYEKGEYFLSELIMAGEVVKEVLKVIEPVYKKGEQKIVGTIVLATVRGDLHDIGKNIVGMLMQFSGFKVVDLGTDVQAENIVKAVEDNGAEILGLSALLSTTVPEFGNIVERLKEAGLRRKVKVIVSGAAVNEEVAKKYGADAWCKTAVEGLNICKKWAGRGVK